MHALHDKLYLFHFELFSRNVNIQKYNIYDEKEREHNKKKNQAYYTIFLSTIAFYSVDPEGATPYIEEKSAFGCIIDRYTLIWVYGQRFDKRFVVSDKWQLAYSIDIYIIYIT